MTQPNPNRRRIEAQAFIGELRSYLADKRPCRLRLLQWLCHDRHTALRHVLPHPMITEYLLTLYPDGPFWRTEPWKWRSHFYNHPRTVEYPGGPYPRAYGFIGAHNYSDLRDKHPAVVDWVVKDARSCEYIFFNQSTAFYAQCLAYFEDKAHIKHTRAFMNAMTSEPSFNYGPRTMLCAYYKRTLNPVGVHMFEYEKPSSTYPRRAHLIKPPRRVNGEWLSKQADVQRM